MGSMTTGSDGSSSQKTRRVHSGFMLGFALQTPLSQLFLKYISVCVER